MEHTCIAWWHLPANWNAISAIATFLATFVALFLPLHLSKKEWDRQGRIRQEDADKARQEVLNVRREVCSAVDQILAYRDAAIAIFDSEPPYLVGHEAIYRIQANASILFDALEVLKTRPELSDGAVFSAVSARKVALEVIGQTKNVVDNWATGFSWAERKAALSTYDLLAGMVQLRADGVRTDLGIGPSRRAASIRSSYLPLADAIKAAKAADSGAPPNTLSATYY